MVPDREGIYRRPQAPTAPLPDVGVHLASNDQRCEVAQLGGDDGGPALVGLVADEGKEEDDEERQKGADCSQRVGGDRVPAERAAGGMTVSNSMGRDTGSGTYTIMDGVYVVSELQVENTAKVET